MRDVQAYRLCSAVDLGRSLICATGRCIAIVLLLVLPVGGVWGAVTITVTPDRIAPGETARIVIDVDMWANPPNRPPSTGQPWRYTPGEEPFFKVGWQESPPGGLGSYATGAAQGAEWIYGGEFRVLPVQTDKGWHGVSRVELTYQAAAKARGEVLITVAGRQSSIMSGKSTPLMTAERRLTIGSGAASPTSRSGGGFPWGWLAAATVAGLGGLALLGIKSQPASATTGASTVLPRVETSPSVPDEAQSQRESLQHRRAQQDYDERQAKQNLDEQAQMLAALSERQRRLLESSTDYRARKRQNEEQIEDAKRGRAWTDEQLSALGASPGNVSSGYGDIKRGGQTVEAQQTLESARIDDALDRLQKMADAAAGRSAVAAADVEAGREKVLQRSADGQVTGVDDASMESLQERLKSRQRVAQIESDKTYGALDDAYLKGLDALNLMKELGKAAAMSIAPGTSRLGFAINAGYGAVDAHSQGKHGMELLVEGGKSAAEILAFEKWLHWMGGTASGMLSELTAGEAAARELGAAASSAEQGAAHAVEDATQMAAEWKGRPVRHLDRIPAERAGLAKDGFNAAGKKMVTAFEDLRLAEGKLQTAEEALAKARADYVSLGDVADRSRLHKWKKLVLESTAEAASATEKFELAAAERRAARDALRSADDLAKRADPRRAVDLAGNHLAAANTKLGSAQTNALNAEQALEQARRTHAANPADAAAVDSVAMAEQRVAETQRSLTSAQQRLGRAEAQAATAAGQLEAHQAAELIIRDRVDANVRKVFRLPERAPGSNVDRLVIGDQKYVQALDGSTKDVVLGFNQGKLSVAVASEQTVTHELLHANTSLDWRVNAGRNSLVNEGVTEYYARRVLSEQIAEGGANWRVNTSYHEPTRFAAKLENLVGSDTLQQAYFHGKTDAFNKVVGEAFGATSSAADVGKNSLRLLGQALDKMPAEANRIMDLLNSGQSANARQALDALRARLMGI